MFPCVCWCLRRNSSFMETQTIVPGSSDFSLNSFQMIEEKLGELSLANNSHDDISISYVNYESELQMQDIMSLIQKDLSEPYSIYTYRYFIHNWPHLCFLVRILFNCQQFRTINGIIINCRHYTARNVSVLSSVN